jgi:DNA-binding NarL/FixJ family response regulator
MRVIVADDSVIMREGVTRLLEAAGFDVVGQAGDREELLRKTRAHKPDIAIVDIRMPPSHTNEGGPSDPRGDAGDRGSRSLGVPRA